VTPHTGGVAVYAMLNESEKMRFLFV